MSNSSKVLIYLSFLYSSKPSFRESLDSMFDIWLLYCNLIQHVIDIQIDHTMYIQEVTYLKASVVQNLAKMRVLVLLLLVFIASSLQVPAPESEDKPISRRMCTYIGCNQWPICQFHSEIFSGETIFLSRFHHRITNEIG